MIRHPMKVVGLAVGAGALICLAVCGTVLLRQRPAGRIVVEPVSFEVERGESDSSQRQETLRVKNETSDSVSITGISSTCGCTVAGEISKSTLSPGDSLAIPLTLTLPAYGERSSVLTLQFATKAEQRAELISVPVKMLGKSVKFPYAIEFPSTINASVFSTGPELIREFDIVTMEEIPTPIWLQTVISPDPRLVVSITPVEAADGNLENKSRTGIERRRYHCVMKAQVPETPDARIVTQIQFTPDGPRTLVSLTRKLPVQAVPSELLVTFVADRDSVEKQVALLSATKEAFDVQMVTSHAPWLSAVSERTPDNRVLLKVTVQKTLLPNITQGITATLDVHTTRPDGLVVKVPVTVAVL